MSATSQVSTIRQHINHAVRVDEARLGKAADWLVDSIHQHVDNITVGIIAGVLVGHDAVIATALGATGCLLSLVAIYMVRHHVHTSEHSKRGQMTAAERMFDEEMRAELARRGK